MKQIEPTARELQIIKLLVREMKYISKQSDIFDFYRYRSRGLCALLPDAAKSIKRMFKMFTAREIDEVVAKFWVYKPVRMELPAWVVETMIIEQTLPDQVYWFIDWAHRREFLDNVLDRVITYIPKEEVKPLKRTPMKNFTNWVSDCLFFQGNTHDITAGALVWAAIGLLIINLTK